MFPEDRVLVGVINRKRDFEIARTQGWYRIPQAQLPRGVNVEYLAFFLSGKVFKEQSGGIHYYTKRKGVELAHRRDLLPKEANHPRAGNVYYKVQIGELIPKEPPVLNPTKRSIGFIHTTWDRFVHARQISDLYSKADYYVDRIYHALRTYGVQPDRFWEAEQRDTGLAPQLRILCEKGTIIASTDSDDINAIFLDDTEEEDAILAEIKAAMARHGGPVTIGIPMD
jgi:hypothetical protein